jgi:hypothetical protein
VTELSAAAAGIVQAFDDRYELLGGLEENWQEDCLAAALRAAADQVVPVDNPLSFSTGAPQAFEIQRRTTRRQLLAIAAELEATTP